MGGQRSGVQRRMQDKIGKTCVYVHCYAHRLNLVVVNTARGIKEVDDFFGLMEATYRYFSVSSLRHDKLVEAQKEAGLKVMEIPRLSDTRWVCRHVAIQVFSSRYKCIVAALSTIVESSTDRSEAAEATGILLQLQVFSFILYLTIFDDVLGLTKPLSDMLQTKHLDLATAMELVDATSQTISEKRSSEYFTDKI